MEVREDGKGEDEVKIKPLTVDILKKRKRERR